jgi:hypothetical protein
MQRKIRNNKRRKPVFSIGDKVENILFVISLILMAGMFFNVHTQFNKGFDKAELDTLSQGVWYKTTNYFWLNLTAIVVVIFLMVGRAAAKGRSSYHVYDSIAGMVAVVGLIAVLTSVFYFQQGVVSIETLLNVTIKNLFNVGMIMMILPTMYFGFWE